MSKTFTGITNDDRRIQAELQAMGAFDNPEEKQATSIAQMFDAIGQFSEWMRWKGEVGVYGCRVGASHARRLEAKHLA
ncbi:hypothetical protein [Neptunomonas qingdaonensis]|uniref:Uncharacterized protein n=1 Tax=Neptunomonas qingdaonensis TaxID=1045558 RepID=A0A1I2RLJ7_9GAMM|nr:hypothetical protein [Neptunomonas qingdaonensis]SFG41428.1 hypothetical protein SAMN05216175_106179 [Neptunomonas qingdaonensis]